MSKLTEKQVKHVAELSKLNLTKEEVQNFTTELSEIIGYIDILNEVETQNIEPTSQTTGLENKTRQDQIRPERTLAAEEATSGTDKTHNNYFKVKAILNKNE